MLREIPAVFLFINKAPARSRHEEVGRIMYHPSLRWCVKIVGATAKIYKQSSNYFHGHFFEFLSLHEICYRSLS